MRIGVIATLKSGMEHFVYRELTFFAAAGLAISVFPTKFRPGLYNPRPEWRLHRWNMLVVVFLQPYFALQAPLKYFRLLSEALSTRALADFFLACYFSQY